MEHESQAEAAAEAESPFKTDQSDETHEAEHTNALSPVSNQ